MVSDNGMSVAMGSAFIQEDSMTVCIPPFMEEGSYKLRALKQQHQSNPVNVNIVSPPKITLAKCQVNGNWGNIVIKGNDFGHYLAGMSAGNAGLSVSTELEPCAINAWSDTRIDVACRTGCATQVTVKTLFDTATAPITTDMLISPLQAACTACHEDRSALVDCNSKKWPAHTRKNLVDAVMATLAEKTYVGGECLQSLGCKVACCDKSCVPKKGIW